MPLKKFERSRTGSPVSSSRGEVGDHLLEPDLDLELREVRAEAEVRAPEAERDVAIRLASHVEAVGSANFSSS